MTFFWAPKGPIYLIISYFQRSIDLNTVNIHWVYFLIFQISIKYILLSFFYTSSSSFYNRHTISWSKLA